MQVFKQLLFLMLLSIDVLSNIPANTSPEQSITASVEMTSAPASVNAQAVMSSDVAMAHEIEDDVVIEADSQEASADPVKSINDYFVLFPQGVREAFYLDGWSYEKSAEPLGQKIYHDGSSILGVTLYDAHKVWIDVRGVANSAILHETGHRFAFENYVKGPYSGDFNSLYGLYWQDWYAKYGGSIKNYDTPFEAYAQCYEMYMLRPDILTQDVKDFMSAELQGIIDHNELVKNAG